MTVEFVLRKLCRDQEGIWKVKGRDLVGESNEGLSR